MGRLCKPDFARFQKSFRQLLYDPILYGIIILKDLFQMNGADKISKGCKHILVHLFNVSLESRIVSVFCKM